MARVKLGADDDELVVTTTSAHSTLMPLNEMQPNPENPRPSDLEVDEMAEDLKDRGQLQNVNLISRLCFVAQKPYLADQLTAAPYVVVNGCRRLAGAYQAGLAGLKYEVHDEWTAAKIDEAMITENVHRLDLNPLLLGEHLKRMLPNYGQSQRKLAEALHKKQPWVNQRISLTNLHPDLQTAIKSGTVLFKTARECTRLHRDLQPLLASGDLPEEIAQLWLVKQRIKPDEQLARWKAGPPYLDRNDAGAESESGGEYRVFTPGPEGSSTIGSGTAEAGVHPDSAGPSSPGQQEADEYPVFTPERVSDETSPQPKQDQQRDQPNSRIGGIFIRLTERSPVALADALRSRLTSEEIVQLVDALRSTQV